MERLRKNSWIVPMLLTFLVHIVFVGESSMLVMTGDEFGPIATTAWFCGENWSDVAETIGYYSYGYSLLLVPLYLITNTATGFYRAAIVLNAVLVACVVPISYYAGVKAFPGIKKRNLCLASFVAANYSAYVVRSQMAWCENLLMVLCWLLLLLLVNMAEEVEWHQIVLSAVVSVYLYTVHQRMLGVLIAYFICLCVLLWKRRHAVRHLALYVATSGVLLGIHRVIKVYVKYNVWNNGVKAQTNDYSSLVSRLDSMENILAVFEKLPVALGGHLFYVGAATLGLGIFACVVLVRKLWKIYFKAGRTEVKAPQMALTYITLAFLGMLGVSLVATSTAEEWRNIEYFMYGRYVEPTLGMLIYFAVIYCFETTRKYADIIITAVIMVISTIIAAIQYSSMGTASFNVMTCIGISVWYQEKIHFIAPLLVSMLVLCALYCGKSEKIKLLTTGCVVCFWIGSGLYYIRNRIIPQEDYYYEYKTLITEKLDRNEMAEFYYYGNRINYTGSRIQFLLKDIATLQCETDYSDIPEEIFYAVTDDVQFLLENPQLDIVEEVNGVWLVTNETKRENQEIELPFALFMTGMGSELSGQQTVTNAGVGGYLLYGPYITLPAGKYEVQIRYRSASMEGSEAGWADVYASETVYDKKALQETGNEWETLTLKFELPERTDRIEIRLVTNEGTQVEVERIRLSKK